MKVPKRCPSLSRTLSFHSMIDRWSECVSDRICLDFREVGSCVGPLITCKSRTCPTSFVLQALNFALQVFFSLASMAQRGCKCTVRGSISKTCLSSRCLSLTFFWRPRRVLSWCLHRFFFLQSLSHLIFCSWKDRKTWRDHIFKGARKSGGREGSKSGRSHRQSWRNCLLLWNGRQRWNLGNG